MLLIGALLVVVVVTPEPPPEQAEALESACSRALKGTCSLQNDGGADSPDAVAIVSLDESTGRAIIQLGRRGRPQQEWWRQTLRFQTEDEPIERFRAIGLTIATLAGEAGRSAQPADNEPPFDEPAGDESVSSGVDSPRHVPVAPSTGTVAPISASESRTWLTLATTLTTGPGLDRGSWRGAGSLRASVRPYAPPLEPTLSISHARLFGEHRGLRASWTRFTVGLLASQELWELRGGLRVEAALEGLAARQQSPPDAGSRWLGGLLLGADVVWPKSGLLGAYLHCDLLSLEGGTALRSGGDRIASSPGNTYSVGVGVQLRIR